jgi:hypothetical protein
MPIANDPDLDETHAASPSDYGALSLARRRRRIHSPRNAPGGVSQAGIWLLADAVIEEARWFWR